VNLYEVIKSRYTIDRFRFIRFEKATFYLSFRKELLKDLKANEEAAAYLDAALEDESKEAFMLALRDVADAKGISELAKKSGLNRENLYKILSEKGKPQPGGQSFLLESMVLKLAVEIKRSKAA